MTKLTRRRPVLRLLPAAVALLCAAPAVAAGTAPPSGAGQPAATSPGPAITGFRNARFGMTEDQVRHVIEQDFHLRAGAIQSGENAIQRTAVLNVPVPGLMAGGGTANVAYVFGYQSHRLIAVNILWSKATDPHITPQQLYQNGEILQQYFAREGFPPQRSTGNVALPDGILLFRAADTAGNVVLLVLSGAMIKDKNPPHRTALMPATLSLAYAADPQHADVYHLSKGSF